jgi:hypothetical protein
MWTGLSVQMRDFARLFDCTAFTLSILKKAEEICKPVFKGIDEAAEFGDTHDTERRRIWIVSADC